MHLWKDRANYEIRPVLQCLFGSFGTPTSIRRHTIHDSFYWHSYLPWILGACGSIHPLSDRTSYSRSLISVKHDLYSIRYPSVVKASSSMMISFKLCALNAMDRICSDGRKPIVGCLLSFRCAPADFPNTTSCYSECATDKLVIAHHGCKIEPYSRPLLFKMVPSSL